MPIVTKKTATAKVGTFEKTPVKIIIGYSFFLWLVPMIIMMLWLSLPLTVDGVTLDLGLFLFWRSLYHLGTCAFIISIACIAMPTPSNGEQATVCFLSIAAALGIDYWFYTTEGGSMLRKELLKLVPLLTCALTLAGMYWAMNRAFGREMARYLQFCNDTTPQTVPALRESFIEHEQSSRGSHQPQPSSTGPTLHAELSSMKMSPSFLEWDATRPSTMGPSMPSLALPREMTYMNVDDEQPRPSTGGEADPTDPTEIRRMSLPVNAKDPAILTATLNARKLSVKDVTHILERAYEAKISLLRRDKAGELFLIFYSKSDLTKNFFWRVTFLIPIAGCYCVCVYYGPLTRYFFEDEAVQAVSVVLFSAALTPLTILTGQLSRRIDQSLSRVEGIPKFAYLGVWCCICFENFFVRGLFFHLKEASSVIIVVCINLVKLGLLFPFRLSDSVIKCKLAIRRAVSKNGQQLEPPSAAAVEEMRKSAVTTFYFVCMAERMSITLLLVCVTIVHNNYNAEFFEDNITASYLRVMGFCLYMLLMEWTGSTILTIVMIKMYKLNALTFGGHVIMNPHLRICCIYIATHIVANYYAANMLDSYYK